MAKSKMKTGCEQEQERFRVTLNFSKEEFELIAQASDILNMSPGKLIKESLLQDAFTDLLKVLIANKENISNAMSSYEKALFNERNLKDAK